MMDGTDHGKRCTCCSLTLLTGLTQLATAIRVAKEEHLGKDNIRELAVELEMLVVEPALVSDRTGSMDNRWTVSPRTHLPTPAAPMPPWFIHQSSVKENTYLALLCYVLVQEGGLYLQDEEGRCRVLAEQGVDNGLGAEHQVVLREGERSQPSTRHVVHQKSENSVLAYNTTGTWHCCVTYWCKRAPVCISRKRRPGVRYSRTRAQTTAKDYDKGLLGLRGVDIICRA
jgi:hypothetical protein